MIIFFDKVKRKVKRKVNSIRHLHFDKFVFIHIGKTGGTSVEKILNIPHEHKIALDKMQEIGIDKWNSKLKFAIVRNPWDKVVSHYHYRVKTNQTQLRDKP
ncbi:MAG: sulfotransferase family 2 domain-containing protein, partial [Pseudomonadota bacterium]|nr:sulfotransferase family 2 domain-containing protein [Pseudomonadota bacterium]